MQSYEEEFDYIMDANIAAAQGLSRQYMNSRYTCHLDSPILSCSFSVTWRSAVVKLTISLQYAALTVPGFSDMQFPEDEQNMRGDVFTTMPMIVESFLRDFKKTIDMDVYVRVGRPAKLFPLRCLY